MSQAALFYDSMHDALAAAVAAIGGAKKVAGVLWPAMKPELAYTRLKHALNEERNEKLCPDEVLLLIREAAKVGCHAIPQYIGIEAGYRFEAVQPEDERARLQRAFVAAVEQLATIQDRIERNEQRLPTLNAVRK